VFHRTCSNSYNDKTIKVVAEARDKPPTAPVARLIHKRQRRGCVRLRPSTPSRSRSLLAELFLARLRGHLGFTGDPSGRGKWSPLSRSVARRSKIPPIAGLSASMRTTAKLESLSAFIILHVASGTKPASFFGAGTEQPPQVRVHPVLPARSAARVRYLYLRCSPSAEILLEPIDAEAAIVPAVIV
jgi:hypothetical protein